ncbi:MAG: polysaccharide biosynthesis tyrosine autokinase [Thermonemataceae bacterium]|nr:polysaccharide biosynthesis tyrosine autokinase [Thermonemataceae bacterium]
MAQFLNEEDKFRQMMQSPELGEDEQSPLDNLDFEKIRQTLLKNWYWLLIVPTFFLSLAFLYLRYTKPIYQSNSNLKMELKDESAGLNVQNLVANNTPQDNIMGELEVIRSPLIFQEVALKMDMSVSYFAEGRVLDNEMYGFSPIYVQSIITNETAYGDKFFISTDNDKTYELKREKKDKSVVIYEGKFGESLREADFEFIIKNKSSLKNYPEKVYFIPNAKAYVMGYLSNNLEAAVVNPQAKIIGISFKDNNANKARDILNTLSEVYRAKSVEIKNRANKQKEEYLDDKIAKTEKELAFYEEQMEKFIIEHKTTNIESKIVDLVKQITEITEQRLKINAILQSLIELEIFVQQRTFTEKVIPLMPEIDAALTTQIMELNKLKAARQKAELSENTNTYAFQSLDLRISILQKSILESVERNKGKLFKQMGELGTKLTEIESAFYGLPSKITEFNKLKKKYETVQSYYNSLIQQKIQIELASAGTVPNFEVIAPANLPTIPISPKKNLIYIIAALAGVLIGLLIVVAKYLLNNTIATQSELEKIVSVPIMGAIPKYRKEKLEVSKLVVHKSPKSAISESLRNIRTNLDFMFSTSLKDKKQATQKVISVTSTISGEGKTFVAINLGGIIAMSGLKVVILDLDMRKPKVHLGLGSTNEKGVSTILIGRHTIDECIKNTEIKGLDFISSGPIPPNPSELVLKEDFDELLVSLQAKYDIVLVDTPPVGLVTDAMIIMQQVDVRLFVLRSNYSRRPFAKNLQRLIKLHQIPRAGLILNSVEAKGSYGYGYGYGYGYYEEHSKKMSFGKKLLQKITNIRIKK